MPGLEHNIGELEVDDDIAFQRVQWVVERCAWVLMSLVLVASVLGWTGGRGIMNTIEVSWSGTLSVEMPRFLRWQAPATMRFEVSPGVSAPTIWLSDECLEAFEIRSIMPEPEGARGENGGVTMTFAAVAAGSQVIIDAVPRRFGVLRGRVGPDPSRAVEFRQVIYP